MSSPEPATDRSTSAEPAVSRLESFCEGVIEAGWLAVLLLVPVYFNVYSKQSFDLDKAVLFRVIALLMAGAWVLEVATGGRATEIMEWGRRAGFPGLPIASTSIAGRAYLERRSIHVPDVFAVVDDEYCGYSGKMSRRSQHCACKVSMREAMLGLP